MELIRLFVYVAREYALVVCVCVSLWTEACPMPDYVKTRGLEERLTKGDSTSSQDCRVAGSPTLLPLWEYWLVRGDVPSASV